MGDWKTGITTPPDWAKDTVRGMYLFGSRSMAVRDGYKRVRDVDFDVRVNIANLIGKHTDYDYAAPDSSRLRDKLIKDDWQEYDTSLLYSPCPLLKGLFIKAKNGQAVQVLLRSNHAMFEEAWESIDPAFWYRYMWKSSPDFMFKHLDIKDAKSVINDMVQQAYNNANRQYGWV
jgi:hypothetical protein